MPNRPFFSRREAGILLHPTSLPGQYVQGVLDEQAFRFIDFIASCGYSVWQILPLCPVGGDGSPYNSTSAFAGNPELISIHKLHVDLFNDASVAEPSSRAAKKQALAAAYKRFSSQADAQQHAFQDFVYRHRFWLEDFALFTVIKTSREHQHWNQWPDSLRHANETTRKQVIQGYQTEYQQVLFEQFVFYQQWLAIKQHANNKGIQVLGDMPIFVSDNSADVWSNKHAFKLDTQGNPTVVAGVPPDYFSATGQRWGNPLYDWDYMESNQFAFWVERMSHALALFDAVRIDHFRGFAACWEIPANEETAINGRWVKTPGQALFKRLRKKFPELPIVAEDLGVISDDVEKLRDDFALPGMKILQFAFDSDAYNPYLPHNHIENCLIYTGTHDNDTTLGWYLQANDNTKERLNHYLGKPAESMPWPLIKSALASVSRLAILPMQDILQLGSCCRMNTPGTSEGNWHWRFEWNHINDGLSDHLAYLNRLYLRSQ